MRVSLLLLAACGTSSSPAAPDSGSVDAGPDAPAAVPMIRVHYPVAGHTITLRTDADWNTDLVGAVSGDEVDFVAPASYAEFKVLLDGVWSLGPNYHARGDVWPRFSTTTGQVVTLVRDFHSTLLGNDRSIYAYLPPSYAENTDATFPVVYIHDGQNLWAALPDLAFSVPWNVDTAFDAAANTGVCSDGALVGWQAAPLGGTPTTCTGDGDCASGSCETFPEAIVIGVANTDARIYEYTPTTDPTTPGGGGADGYVQMLTSELKPQIDQMLRTQPDPAATALAGSSLGGLVTAYAATTAGDTFTRFAELSPSTWWNADWIVPTVAAQGASAPHQFIYVDSGSGDADDEADTDMLAATYEGLGCVDGAQYHHVVQEGATHSEVYWAQRFPGAMQLILGAR
ncbi:MAG TPA: alpha/beta hydrolase-fold protein [Kofleriaceae bacterium]